MEIIIFISLIAFIMLQPNIYGQNKMIIENKDTNERIKIEPGDYVNIEYRGYMHQLQTYKTFVASISESSILSKNSSTQIPNDNYIIKGNDITGFRKMFKLQPYLKPIVNLVLPIGTYFILANNTNLLAGEMSLYTTLESIGIKFLLDFILPENIEFHIADGWSIRPDIISI